MSLRVGVDIGGTFTDFAVLDPDTGQFEIGKVLSTPDDPARAVIEGLVDRISRSGGAPRTWPRWSMRPPSPPTR